MLRKPGPAMSTRAIPGVPSSWATIASATARGGTPAFFASWRATLVAQSPCSRWRGRSTCTVSGSSAGSRGTAPAPTAASRAARSAADSSAGVTRTGYRARRGRIARVSRMPGREAGTPGQDGVDSPGAVRRSRPGMTTPRARTGLIEAAVADLRERITSGQWPVGTRIPPEPALTEMLGVGRNTVREAVQALVHSGLLARRQGSGTYVLADDELAVSIGRHIAGASRRDVLQVRRALEVEAARLAAQRHTPADDERLLTLLRERTAAWEADDVDAMVTTDLELHREIARVSRNPVLESIYENLLEAIVENIRTNLAGAGHDDHDHTALVEAIVDSDPKRAGDEVVRYLAAMLHEEPESP